MLADSARPAAAAVAGADAAVGLMVAADVVGLALPRRGAVADDALKSIAGGSSHDDDDDEIRPPPPGLASPPPARGDRPCSAADLAGAGGDDRVAAVDLHVR